MTVVAAPSASTIWTFCVYKWDSTRKLPIIPDHLWKTYVFATRLCKNGNMVLEAVVEFRSARTYQEVQVLAIRGVGSWTISTKTMSEHEHVFRASWYNESFTTVEPASITVSNPSFSSASSTVPPSPSSGSGAAPGFSEILASRMIVRKSQATYAPNDYDANSCVCQLWAPQSEYGNSKCEHNINSICRHPQYRPLMKWVIDSAPDAKKRATVADIQEVNDVLTTLED